MLDCAQQISTPFVIKDREREIQVWKNFKVYFEWGWNNLPFDINSGVFHFDNFNYGRRFQNLLKDMLDCAQQISTPFGSNYFTSF
jgi:hypothetical protein